MNSKFKFGLWGVAILATLVVVAALLSRARALSEANLHEARAAELALQVDSISSENARLRAVVSEVDTIYVEVVRAVEREVPRLRTEAEEVATVLAARLDHVSDSLFATYVTQRDSIESLYQRQIDVLSSRVFARDELIASLYAEISIRQAREESLLAANDALRRAVAPGFFARIFDSWESHATVLAVGVVAGIFIDHQLIRADHTLITYNYR